jgi:hypothetical protein
MELVLLKSDSVFFYLEKGAKQMHELVEDEVRKHLVLDVPRELVQHLLLVVIVYGLKLVLLPPELEVALDPLLQVRVDVLALVVAFHEPKKFRKVIPIVNVSIHDLVGLNHVDEVAHDIGEDHDASNHNDGTKDPLVVVFRMEVAETYGRQRCERVIK